jgi:hypothetical protein
VSVSPQWRDLRPGEQELSDPSELLWRQIHPTQVDDGKLSSSAFVPNQNDEGQLSTCRGSKVSAEGAFENYTQVRKRLSAGVFALSVGEVVAVDLRAIDDSEAPSEEELPPGHTYVDFRQVPSTNKCKKIGARLRDKAESRGWQFHP